MQEVSKQLELQSIHPLQQKTRTMKLALLSEEHWWWKQTIIIALTLPESSTTRRYPTSSISKVKTPFLEVITPVTRWFSGIDRVYWLTPFLMLSVFNRGPFKKTCWQLQVVQLGGALPSTTMSTVPRWPWVMIPPLTFYNGWRDPKWWALEKVNSL